MVKKLTFPQTTEIEQLKGQQVIYMQNGAPNHHILAVRITLNNGFPNGWMSRDGEPTPKSPRSLDLTPGLLSGATQKNIVYADKIQSSMHLREQIFNNHHNCTCR